MPEIRTFFRHCPACGRRFEIRLVSKERIEDMEHVDERNGLLAPPGVKEAPMPTVVHDAAPVMVDMEEFQYTYRCKHCGHQWSEVHEKTDVAPRSADYKGD